MNLGEIKTAWYRIAEREREKRERDRQTDTYTAKCASREIHVNFT
jgi:hypothetical protein